MTFQSPAQFLAQSTIQNMFLAVGLGPVRRLFGCGTGRLITLGLLLTLCLLAGGTDRAFARLNSRAGDGVRAPAVKTALVADRNGFRFKPRALDLSRAFQPANVWELMSASGWVVIEPASLFTTIIVNGSADATPVALLNGNGTCDLREAIMAANGDTAVNECPAGSGMDTIAFNIGSSTPTINIVGSALPAIDQPVTINGNTGGATRVRINGFALDMFNQHGLQINASGSSVKSLVISNFTGSGILINASNVLVQNCYIGTDATGMIAEGNLNGILIQSGVVTLIGVDDDGVNNAFERNVISGNLETGILISATGVITIAGNYIGVDATGNAALANGGPGILLASAPNNVIGGTNHSGEGNVISGNSGHGVDIVGGESFSNGLVNNLIGRNATNSVNIPNGGDGVSIGEGAPENTIGLVGSPNVIAGNLQNGVSIGSGQGNRVSSNKIFGNTGLGIDLLGDGVTPNDGGDGDSGANGLQNFPVLTSVSSSGQITGSLDSTVTDSLYPVVIEFFENVACDPSGNGEGQFLIGSTTVAGPGAFNYNAGTMIGLLGNVITATATDNNGNTSEFSACQPIVQINPTMATFQSGGGTGMVAVTCAGCSWTASSNDGWITITSGFNGTGNGTVNYTVANAASPRSGTMTIAGQTFTVTQIVDGAIIVGDFSSGIPPAWQVVDGGTPAVYDNTGTPLTWTTLNPCNQMIPAPFVPPFAIVDASCTSPDAILDEELRLPPFDATGLGSVFVEFYSQFEWAASAPNNKGDVDVSTDGGMTWTNVLRLENSDDGVPTPVLKSINITPYISDNPANVLVRLHYYGMSTPLAPSLRAAIREMAYWGVDFGVYSYALTSSTPSFPTGGGEGRITVATSPAIQQPRGEWTAVSNATDWITITSPVPVIGNGAVTFSVAPNTGAPRIGTITVSGRIFTVMQDGGCSVTVNPATLPAGTAGTAYNQMLTASPSGSYTFAVTAGALPPGLSLASGGAFTGTPTAAGTYNFTVTATGSGSCTGVANYSLFIACPTITLSSLPAGTAGTAYNQTLTTSPSGSYTFAVTAGSLPTGLSLAPSGAITGTPTVRGTYNFTVTATGAGSCTGNRAYSLTINCPTVLLAPPTLPNGQLATSYSQTITATPTGGNYTFAVSSGSLPPGLTLSAAGLLSGTPTLGGTFNFRITATGFGTCSNFRDYQLVVSSCPTITVIPPTLSDGVVGKNYGQNVNATPTNNYTFAVTSGTLPNGLKLDAATGKISGPPKKAGTSNFTIQATGTGGCTGSRAYTIRITSATSQAISDYDGDGKTDFAVWRGMTSEWLIVKSSDDKVQTELWGAAYEPYRDVIAPGDYDGDGQSDLAVFRRSNGHWYIKQSSGRAVIDRYWGLGTDLPVPGDYDGDGKTDIAVWRGAEGNWYIVRSSDGVIETMRWGAGSAPYLDVPVPADYDGDGQTDVAVFRQTTGYWYIKQSSDGLVVAKHWGLDTDVPVVADYDGDGKADIAVWRGADTNWYVVRSSDGAIETVSWGTSDLGDVPVPGDYDGDGKTDFAVWRPSAGRWYVKSSLDSSVLSKINGKSGDTPVMKRR